MGKNLEVRENTGPAAAPGSVELQGRWGWGPQGWALGGKEAKRRMEDFVYCLKAVNGEATFLKNQDTAWSHSHLRTLR